MFGWNCFSFFLIVGVGIVNFNFGYRGRGKFLML